MHSIPNVDPEDYTETLNECCGTGCRYGPSNKNFSILLVCLNVVISGM